MKLNLSKPLVFFDLETTGINVGADRIVEYSFLKIFPDDREELRTSLVNPTIPIPYMASQVHGIYDKDVSGKPTFKELASELKIFLDDSDLAGYNSNKFDIPLLAEEFLRAEIDFEIKGRKLIDVQNIFHKMEERTLSAAYKFYCAKNLENAHSAEADIKATYEILRAQIMRYEKLQNDMNFLHEFSSRSVSADLAGRIIYDKNGSEIFNFGKYKGKKVEEILHKDTSYYSWMMQGDFPLYTKKVLTEIKNRMKQKTLDFTGNLPQK